MDPPRPEGSGLSRGAGTAEGPVSEPPAGGGSRAWAWREVEMQPLSRRLEDALLLAIRQLTSHLDVEGVCTAVLGGVEAVFGATSSWIMLHDPAASVLRTNVFRGRGADVYRDVEVPADHGVAGLAFSRREIHFVPDVQAEDRWFNPERVRLSGLQSVFVVPLIADDRAIGVLGLDSPQFGSGNPPTDLDLKRLEVFATQAAVGIINARLYQTSQQERARLRALVRQRRELRRQVLELREAVRDAGSFGMVIGDSPLMRTVLEELNQVASSNVTVLLLGETGTGKELLARALHEQSARAPGPFVPVNCAALPESLVESEMFGHERGAFTGANARKPGRFELAHRGTLFLDEIGDLPANAQAKLLRVLQDREVHRVGSTQAIKVDVRLVAATNQDLTARVIDGSFRQDLYYRISVFPIQLPPLRDRLDDIPQLAAHIVPRLATRLGKRIDGLEAAAVEKLREYSWPGNVRELQNVLERAVILAAGPVVSADSIRIDPAVSLARFPPAAAPGPAAAAAPPSAPAPAPAPPTLADAERAAIISALRAAEGRISGPNGAATLLNVKPTTLHAKMKKLGVGRKDAMAD